jgi:hypothetical protein
MSLRPWARRKMTSQRVATKRGRFCSKVAHTQNGRLCKIGQLDRVRPDEADVAQFPYFVTNRRVGVTVLVGAIGEIENVSQVFHPAGRLAWSNSPYPFRLR